jgi:transposase
MSFHRYDFMDLHALITRWHAGYGIRQISRMLKLDRKTVQRYVRLAEAAGLSRELPLPEKAELLRRLEALLPALDKPQPARNAFAPHRDELLALLTNAHDPLLPKTAYEVLCARHELAASYSTFKRFLGACQPERLPPQTTCRFEVSPGEEVQVDYAKMGLLYDPHMKKNRVLHAFIATLSFSRLKYIEFAPRMDQKSFVAAHVRMLEFFGGVPQRVVIDNLKAGVVKPDLYEPKLNRAYEELAEHYGFFVDAARVRHPKDKGKVERTVPLVRELFRKLKALHPQLELATANHRARDWALLDNGMKPHGTTGLLPAAVYRELERPALKALPASPFVLATWKAAKVHVDQFIQFEKKFYALPAVHVGKSVWIRATDSMVEVYDDYQRLKQYPKNQQTRLYDPQDFPENFKLMLEAPTIKSLLARAQAIGPNFTQVLEHVLTPHAMLNYRRALALLALAEKYRAVEMEAVAPIALRHRIFVPKLFQRLLEKQPRHDDHIPISSPTQELLRSPDYFMH